MNRRMAMGGDTSLNVPMREDGDGQWQDWLVDDEPLHGYALVHMVFSIHAKLCSRTSCSNNHMLEGARLLPKLPHGSGHGPVRHRIPFISEPVALVSPAISAAAFAKFPPPL